MIKPLTLAATAITMTVAGLAANPVAAQSYDGQRYGYDQGGYQEQRGYPDRRGYPDPRGYPDDRRRYDDRRYSDRRCRNGTTGTILGAIAGGLLGNSIAGRGDRTVGTVLGAGGGALAGRAIEKGGCR